MVASGVNDFATATLDEASKAQSGALGKLPPLQQWVKEVEALARQVGGCPGCCSDQLPLGLGAEWC